MKEEKLRTLSYINVPSGLKLDLGSFRIDPSIKLPVQRPEGQKTLRSEDITVEAIVSGMLTVIAYDEAHPAFNYFRSFVLAVEPGIAEELNAAAIAKEQQKDYDFAEELFLAVYHILPQSASCINLATLYSYMSVDAEEKKNDEDEDKYLLLAKRTLQDGLRRFGESESILAELSSFEAYMGNLEDAKEYLDRYMMVATEGEKKQEMKKLLQQINLQIENDNDIKEAYDYIMLDKSEKALSVIERFISNNPKLWNGYFIKAWALRKIGKYDDARECLLECLRLGESSSDIYNELSICELETGNRDLAKTYLETAADLDEGNLTVVSNLAYLYMMDKEFDQAREYLEKARYLSKNDSIIKSLIDQYESMTGEKLGDIIHEEIVHDKDTETEFDPNDDGYQAELAEIAKDDIPDGNESHECGCHHHEHEEHECGCHHDDEEHECGCHHHEHEDHECGCHHDHEEHECGCHHHDHEGCCHRH
ncbi:MAG: hypothetical protein SPJ34_09660 [Candidatus Ornithospirochaeta sp.]|nr:hypothetical protein [Candidatus Ornithospirochaeta sp.]